MHWGNGWNFGMHVIGWLTWAVLIAAAVWVLLQAAGERGSTEPVVRLADGA